MRHPGLIERYAPPQTMLTGPTARRAAMAMPRTHRIRVTAAITASRGRMVRGNEIMKRINIGAIPRTRRPLVSRFYGRAFTPFIEGGDELQRLVPVHHIGHSCRPRRGVTRTQGPRLSL